MQIEAKGIGKRFQGQVVIQPMDVFVDQPGVYVLLGGNGSGKSTLMKMLAGMLTPSRGTLNYTSQTGETIPAENRYKHLAFAGPYHDVIEEMTLIEFLRFTSVFRPFMCSAEDCLDLMNLTQHAQKLISVFSSGMKQRVKLGLALFSTADVLFLDEPVSHLDAKAIDWYQVALAKAAADKIVFVASNHNPLEYPNAIRQIVVD